MDIRKIGYRTLGSSIAKLRVKDFRHTNDTYASVNLGDGDTDWAEVSKALSEIQYRGSVIAELEAGDERYLRDVSKRTGRLVLGRA